MAFDHAVVVGAGIGGLLSAAALAERFAQVTIVERDELPTTPQHRSGVPQGEQMHALLAIGQDAVEDLLPGIGAELRSAGAAWFDSTRDIASFSSLGWTARGPSEAWTLGIRRLVLEHAVRERVRALTNVTFRRGTVIGLRGSPERVAGVAVRPDASPPGEADLVVDASGRTSHATHWLEALGCAAPPAQEIVSDIIYATALVRLPPGALGDDVRGILAPPHPAHPRGAVLLPCEEGMHQVVALAQHGVRAPVERDDFLDHLASAATPLVVDAVREAEFVDGPKPFKVRGTRRIRWEDAPANPEGLVVIGDAAMALNPIYGQGMSVAAVQARAMRDVVGAATTTHGLARRVQESFRPTLDFVFGSVLRSDAGYPATTLHGVEAPEPSTSRILGSLATEDWRVAVAMRYAAHWFTAEPVQRPEIRARARAWAKAQRRVRHTDPRVIPPAFAGEPVPR